MMALLCHSEIMTSWRMASLLAAACLMLACTRRSQQTADRSSTPAPPAPFYSEAHIVPGGSTKAAPLAPGRIVTIYGEHLGPAQPCQGSADPTKREPANPLRPHQTVIETQVFP